MRKLYLVPILHMKADMGSLASALEKVAAEEIGDEAWQKHEQAISSFWDSIADFFSALDVKGFKIYQDGMVAEGPNGLRIVKEGISRGSKNFEIVGSLLERGAILVKTEDPLLVKREYDYIAKIAHSTSQRERETWALRYKLAQDKLLKQRDNFIAETIRETLGGGETGVLFIGAYHDVTDRLPKDIQVVQVKDISTVREYYKALTGK
ncbi:MAG: hypothetical protein HYX84_02245 [Chloroflexi bacterium]|nr:hypothetical protein [Chloroflexota bacterium]